MFQSGFFNADFEEIPTPRNGQTHSNNLSAKANKLFECVWPFCGIGGLRVNNHRCKLDNLHPPEVHVVVVKS